MHKRNCNNYNRKSYRRPRWSTASSRGILRNEQVLILQTCGVCQRTTIWMSMTMLTATATATILPTSAAMTMVEDR